MNIYGLSIPNFFAAIVVGLVLSFLLVSVLVPVDSVNHNDVKKETPQPSPQHTPQSEATPIDNVEDLVATFVKIMVLVTVASVVFVLLFEVGLMKP